MKFKVGDKVRCLPGYNILEYSGGAGYVSDREFIIGYITNQENSRPILWVNFSECGIYADVCELTSKNFCANSKLIFKFV